MTLGYVKPEISLRQHRKDKKGDESLQVVALDKGEHSIKLDDSQEMAMDTAP